MGKEKRLADIVKQQKLKNNMILNVSIAVAFLVVIPLVLKCPCIRGVVRFLLSVSEDQDYVIAYLEFISTFLGSFLAIGGALWTERKINEAEANAEIRKHARIVYYDLKLSVDAIIKIMRQVTTIDNMSFASDHHTAVHCFAERAIKKTLKINDDWLLHVAEIGDYLITGEVSTIYNFYSKLTDISNAMASGQTDQIEEIFISHICWFINDKSLEYNTNFAGPLKNLEKLTDEIHFDIVTSQSSKVARQDSSPTEMN